MSGFLTDGGLDNFALGAINSGLTSANYIQYAAVSTDVFTPSNGSTSLPGQLGSRSNSDGGFTLVDNITAEGGKLKRQRTFYRVFNFTSSHNLTGWALFPGATGGEPSYLDRFREDNEDVESDPQAIPVQDGDQLHLIYIETTELDSFGAVAATIGWTLNATPDDITGESTFYATTEGNRTITYNAFYPNQAARRIATLSAVTVSETAAGTVLEQPAVNPTLSGYVNGDHFRDATVAFTTAQSNGTIVGLRIIGSTTSGAGGFKTIFGTPASKVKNSLQTLTVTARSSWGRA